MKVAVITDEIDADVERATAVMAEYGVHAAELRQIWDKNIVDAPREYWQRAKDILVARGMTVVGIASPFYKCALPGDPVEGPAGPMHSATARGLADQIEVLERSIEAARFFDTKLIRVFSFWRRQSLSPTIEEAIVDAFAEPAAIASEAGVVLGLENEHACYIGTGAQAGRVLGKIRSSSVRAIWDPGNAFCDGEQPFPHGYEGVRDFLVHVHVKDAAVGPGKSSPEWTVVGEGEIDYRGQVRALRESGYTGYLSLETHYTGAGSKEASSRVCLEGLIKLVNSG
jgi:sugar phosphate isomerase/epimerase